VSEQQNQQHLLDLPKVIAVGIASPAGAALTSRFGVAGTLVGLALSAVIITIVTDLLKVYLARVPGAVTSIPGGLRKKPARRFVYRIGLPFSKFSSLVPKRRRSIIIGSIVGGGVAFFIGLSIVTAFEASVGKNLSCWIWNNCPTAATSTEGEASNTSTLQSIFGGGQNPSNSTPPVETPTPNSQPAPGSPGAQPVRPSQPQASPGSEAPGSSPQPDQQKSPSGSSEYQGSSPDTPENQQQSEYKQPTGKSGGKQQEEITGPLYLFTT
jgi:hypothetical protein